MSSPSSHCLAPNTDISGIGVRTAAYAQNLISFVPAVLTLVDNKVSPEELCSLADQSVTILLSAYALLIAGLILAPNQLDNYHATIVLNLSWMNNTNTFIYILLLWHHKPGLWANLRWPPPPVEKPKVTLTSPMSARVYLAIYNSSPTLAALINSVSPVILIGSLHLSLMSALGIWLWISPGRFGISQPCSLESTFSLLGNAIPLSSQTWRVIWLAIYVVILVPGLNLILPTAIFCAPLYLLRLRKAPEADIDPKQATSTGLHPVNGSKSVRETRATQMGLVMLMFVNILFVIDTELSISRNESPQGREDSLWTFGQTLALLLLLLPLWNIAGMLKIMDGPASAALLKEEQARAKHEEDRVSAARAAAVQGPQKYTDGLEWETVKQWVRDLQGEEEVCVGGTWIHAAVHLTDEFVLDFAVNHHRNLNEQDNTGTTSIDYALKGGHQKTVQLLLARGAVFDVSDHLKTSLHYAAEGGHLDVVKYMVSRKKEMIRKNEEGKMGHNGTIDDVCSLKLKTEINAKDLEEKTVIHYASMQGSLEIMKYLVREGVKHNARDKFGRTSLHYAARNGHLKIVQYLVQRNGVSELGRMLGEVEINIRGQCNNNNKAPFL
ncbi:ankyrin repeat-containing domain protein [Mycena filopes]|nr:ankyrin repeat-containing domain protein [Mycena filopes]KAJ7162438.1 ankyrin repeat-containing domain protein [Mycena filopes]